MKMFYSFPLMDCDEEKVSPSGGTEAVLEEEFGEDLCLSSEEESPEGEGKMPSFWMRRHSTSQLFTTSTSRHFGRACARFASRRKYRCMAEHCNRAAWKARVAPLGIRSLKAVDMAWRCNLLEEALAILPPPNPGSRRLHARSAKEATEEELAIEVQEAEQQCVQEESDVRLLEGEGRVSKRDLLNDEELGRRAQEILGNSDALVTRAAVKELSRVMELWIRDLVIDALRYEQERRWARVAAVKTPYVQMASLNAAFSRSGLPVWGNPTAHGLVRAGDIPYAPILVTDDSSVEGEEQLFKDPTLELLSDERDWLPEELLKLQYEARPSCSVEASPSALGN